MIFLNKLRQIKWLEIVPCFCIGWWLDLLFVTGTSRFSLPPEITLPVGIDICNIFIPALVCCIMGAGINYNIDDNTSARASFLRNVLVVFILVFIDQMIKFLLFSRYGDAIPVITSESYENGNLKAGILQPPILVIVKDWFFMQPLLHKSHILQDAYGMPVSLWGTFLLAGIGLLFIYRYSRFSKAEKWLLDKAIILLTAMVICFGIDKLAYEGSIDFIRLAQFGVFDLKDVYGTLAVSAAIQAEIHNRSWQMIKRVLAFKGSLTEFKEYINCEYKVIKNIPAFFKKNSQ